MRRKIGIKVPGKTSPSLQLSQKETGSLTTSVNGTGGTAGTTGDIANTRQKHEKERGRKVHRTLRRGTVLIYAKHREEKEVRKQGQQDPTNSNR